MKNKRGLSEYAILVLVIVFAFLVLMFYFRTSMYAYHSPEPEYAIKLYFYDKNTGCSLDGEIYIDNRLVGRTDEAFFKVSKKQYNKNKGKILCIFGQLNECFGNYYGWVYENCFFLKLNVTDRKFEKSSVFPLQADIQPRHPYKRAMMQFIKPKEVSGYLADIKPSYSSLKDIRKILKFVKSDMGYVDDEVFGKSEYWLTPQETLTLKKGDCEDWAITSLSLIKAYDPELKCYNIVLPTHLSVLCYLSSSFYIFDMNLQETRSGTIGNWNLEDERQTSIAFLQKYFDSYEINETKREIRYAFSDNEFYEFKDNEDFINWMLELHYIRKLR